MKTFPRPLLVLGKSEFWISLFVIVYIFLSLTWLTRTSNPIIKRLVHHIGQITLVLGLDQNWSLFSPTIRDFNLHNLAIIRFRDGMIKLYEWPRMDRADWLVQARDEKYRKMFIDCMPWQPAADLLPAVSRFVARANANPDNPPVRINLCYFWSKTPLATSQDNLPWQSKYHCYFIYEVQPRDIP
jgi:hypothetical protein